MEEDGYFTNLLIEGSSAVGLDGLRSQLEEEHLPMVDNTRSARPNQKRSKNFSEEEDVLLVSAWLNISMDPVLGTNQTRSAFWKRIYDFFHENKDFTSDPSQSSLFHRWTTIQEHANKFCGCVSQIELRRESGATAHDNLPRQWLCLRPEMATSAFNSHIAGMCRGHNQSGTISRSKYHLRNLVPTKNRRQPQKQVRVRLIPLMVMSIMMPEKKLLQRPKSLRDQWVRRGQKSSCGEVEVIHVWML